MIILFSKVHIIDLIYVQDNTSYILGIYKILIINILFLIYLNIVNSKLHIRNKNKKLYYLSNIIY